MHLLKLVLPLAGLLMASQALAYKASHAMAATPATARSPLVRSVNIPAAPVDGVGGRSIRTSAGVPTPAAVEAIVKSTDTPARINRSH
jgi:hypothetical protein